MQRERNVIPPKNKKADYPKIISFYCKYPEPGSNRHEGELTGV